MSGFTRYLMLTAKAKTGLTPAFPILLAVAAVTAVATFILLNVVIYLWSAQKFGPLPTAIGMMLTYLVLCIVLVMITLQLRRATMQQAQQALAARSTHALFDTSLLTLGLQVGRAVGLKRFLPVAVIALIAAGVAKEWARRSGAQEADEE
jgi:divalent metal cation (Fe/Co/Zn/Cd) transporter